MDTERPDTARDTATTERETGRGRETTETVYREGWRDGWRAAYAEAWREAQRESYRTFRETQRELSGERERGKGKGRGRARRERDTDTGREGETGTETRELAKRAVDHLEGIDTLVKEYVRGDATRERRTETEIESTVADRDQRETDTETQRATQGDREVTTETERPTDTESTEVKGETNEERERAVTETLDRLEREKGATQRSMETGTQKGEKKVRGPYKKKGDREREAQTLEEGEDTDGAWETKRRASLENLESTGNLMEGERIDLESMRAGETQVKSRGYADRESDTEETDQDVFKLAIERAMKAKGATQNQGAHA